MMSINNRFAGLQMNAKDPFTSKKGRTKSEGQKSAVPKVKSDRTTNKAAASSQPSVTEKVKTEPISVSKLESISKPTETHAHKNIEITVSDISFQKDDRAAQNRNEYRKVLVNSNKRLLERHGAKDVRINSVEKRQGHGSYNWGDAIESEVVLLEQDEKNEVEEAEKECIMQYTLEQYQEMLKDNKVNPLQWKEQVIRESESDRVSHEKNNDFDVREYQYRPEGTLRGGRGGFRRGSRPPRPYQEGRGGFRGDQESTEEQQGGNRGANRSRGRGRGRGGNRNGNGSSYRGRGFSGPQDQKKPQDVRIDDQLDFPDIDRFN